MSCPNGLVIPDDLNSTDNWYPNRTLSECAFRCDHFILFTEEEWQREMLMKNALNYICFIGLVITIYVLVVDRHPNQKPRQYGYFMEVFIFSALSKCLVDIIVLNEPVESRLCRNNANFMDESDGFTACAVEANINMQTSVIFISTWAFQSLNIFCRTVLHWKTEKMNKYKHIYVPCILVFPTVLSGGGIKAWGSKETYGQCLPSTIVKPSNFRNVMLGVLVLIGVICMMLVIANAIRLAFSSKHSANQISPSGSFGRGQVESSHYADRGTELESGWEATENEKKTNGACESSDIFSFEGQLTTSWFSWFRGKSVQVMPLEDEGSASNAEDPFWKLVTALKYPLFITLSFLALFIVVLEYYSKKPPNNIVLESINMWGDCVLRHFDGNDGSWIPACGEHPHIRPNPHLRQVMAGFLLSQGLVLITIYLPKTISYFRRLYAHIHSKL